MFDTLLSITKEKVEKNVFLGDVPHAPVYNLSQTRTNLDTDTGIYAPRAIMQINIENYGNQAVSADNQDIVILGSFTEGARFINRDKNNPINSGGIVVINPIMKDSTANALLYNGYNVSDGDAHL